MDGDTELLQVLGFVEDEVRRAVDKHGEQHQLSDADWLVVVTEELGESAHHISERILGNPIDETELDTELIQTAAMVVRWMVERTWLRHGIERAWK